MNTSRLATFPCRCLNCSNETQADYLAYAICIECDNAGCPADGLSCAKPCSTHHYDYCPACHPAY